MLAAQAMTVVFGEVSYPVMSMIKWQRTFYGMIASPLNIADVVLAHLGFVLFRVGTVCAVFTLVMAPFGVFESWWGVLLSFPVQLLIGLAFAAPLYAITAAMKDESGFSLIFRLGMIPLFLFSGAFFPISNLGPVMEWVARLTPLWQGVDLTRMLVLGTVDWSTAADPRRLPRGAGGGRLPPRHPQADLEAGRLMALLNQAIGRSVGAELGVGEATGLLLYRNYLAYRSAWWIFVTGFLEPVFYLFSIGIGVGQLVTGFEFHGQTIPYAEFVAPGMLAAVGDERRAARLDVQLLLQAEVQQALRPDAGHAPDHERHRPWRAELVAAARRHLLRGLPVGDGRDGSGALLVGGARPAGGVC